jgi:hypothetical protein
MIWPFSTINRLKRNLGDTLEDLAKARMQNASQAAATRSALASRDLAETRVRVLEAAISKAYFADPKTGRRLKRGVVPVGLI